MFDLHRDRDVHIEITSMIDVMFILVIFFVVTTRFAEQTAVEIELPRTEGESQRLEPDMARLAVDADGKVWLDGKVVPLLSVQGELESRFEGVVPEKRIAQVDGDRVAHWETMLTVLDGCRKAHVQAAVAITRPAEDGSQPGDAP